MNMRIKLEEVCERGTSNLRQSDVEGKTGAYPIYGAAGYIGNVDFYHQEKPYVAVVKDGAGIGRTMLLPAKSSVIGTMQYLLPKDNIKPEYLKYVVQYMHLEKYFSGATIPHIYFRDYKNEIFNFEPLERQSEIVEALQKVEQIIDSRKKELQALDDLIKARFVEMFGACPERKRLEEFTSLITKGASPKWQGVDYCDEGTLFVTSENIREGYVDLSKRKYLPDEINEIQPRSVLHRNDVLVNIVGASIGRAAVFESDELANINQAVALVRIKKDAINLRFLITFLNSPEAQKTYGFMKKGGARDNLSLKNISDLMIPVADVTQQHEFAEFVAQVDKSKLSIQKALDQSQLLFDSLMQKYFGEK